MRNKETIKKPDKPSITDQNAREKSSDTRPKNNDFCVHILDNLPGIAYRCLIDQHWTMLFVSEGARDLTGYEPADFIENATVSYNDIIHPDDRERVRMKVDEIMDKQKHRSFEYRIVTKSGETKWVWEQAVRVKGDNGTECLDGIVLDITDRIHLNQALRLEQQRLGRVVDSTADIIFEIDNKKRFVSVYGKGLEHIGLKSEDFTNKTVIDIFGPDEGSPRHQAYQKALEGETVHYDWTHRHNDQTLYFSSSLSPIINMKGRVVGAVGIAREVTEQKRHQQHIERLSYRDQLTGAYNRYYLYESIEREMSLADRYREALSMITFDIDIFKRINDDYGHAVGDEALKNLTFTVTHMIRKSDILFRTGGEEFVLVLPKTSQRAAMKLAERIRQALAMCTHHPYGTLTCSFGVASRLPGESFDAWWKRGDQAMYQGKRHGGNCVQAANEARKTT